MTRFAPSHKVTFPVFAVMLVGLAVVLVTPMRASAQAAEVLPLDKTTTFELENKGSKDFSVTLPKGDSYVVLDYEREKGSFMGGSVELLKPNGVLVSKVVSIIEAYTLKSRLGSKFRVAVGTKYRMRVTLGEGGPTKFWLTVLPANRARFVPLGYGGELKTLKIGDENGEGATVEEAGHYYYRATLPPGKWSISLGVKQEKRASYAFSVDLTDSLGLITTRGFVTIIDYKSEPIRKEAILTVPANPKNLPRVIYLRAGERGKPDEPLTFDVSITKATP